MPLAQYNALTPEQKRAIYERRHGAQPQGPPSTVHVNAQGVENNSILTLPTSNLSVATPAQSTAPGTMLRSMLSNSSVQHSVASNDNPNVISINGTRFQQINKLTYRIRNFDVNILRFGSLIDGGANGGMSGSDVRLMETTSFNADVTGLGDHTLSSLPICTVAAVVDTTSGSIVAFFCHYAHYGQGQTVHSVSQLVSFGLLVDDRSRKVGGTQRIVTPEGHIVPLHIRDGLAYMDMRPPTDLELTQLPHVFFTADTPWDPTILDNEFLPTEFEDSTMPTEFVYQDPRINDYGERISNHFEDFDNHVDDCVHAVQAMKLLRLNPQQTVLTKKPDFDLLRPNFGWMPSDRIRQTFDATTQFYRATVHHPFRKHYRSRFPAANVDRRPEWFATDTYFSDTSAHNDGIPGHGGAQMLQLYTGVDSLFLAGYPMRTKDQMPDTLEDLIRDFGAPKGLFSDNAKEQTSAAVKSIERMYCIKDYQCEPHHQHQNFAERRIQDVKRLVNTIMDRTGTPAVYWLLCTLYVIYLLNHVVHEKLGGLTPITKAFGYEADISALLTFHWWQPVYYAADSDFPSQSKEKLGRWVGVAEKQGDALTYLVLTDDTFQVIARSAIRPASDPMFPNKRAETVEGNLKPAGGESPSKYIYTVADKLGIDPTDLKLPLFSPDELVGLTFLKPTEDGQTLRAKVVRKIRDQDSYNHHNIQFLVEVGDNMDELIAYNELSDLIERQHEDEAQGKTNIWVLKEVIDHQGPLKKSDKNYKGSKWNLLVRWEDNSETWEPLEMLRQDDPVTCARYGLDNNLLDKPGWHRLKRIAEREQLYKRMLKQSQMKSMRRGIRYKFGVRLPLSYKDAIEQDKANGNTDWQDAVATELGQIASYNTFKDMGKGVAPPQGYQRINVHLIFDVKPTLARKARLVAGGHMTEPPKESVYSGVVSLRSLRLICFLAELNNLELMSADIGNAYLEAYTKEKVYCVAGSEFGELAGHTLVIVKALYGLRTSGARFHERLADTLRDLGFTPSYADPDVWMKDAGETWDYVCVYVDDLLAAMQNPKWLMDKLQDKPFNYKLKGVAEPKYHLGGDFFRDKDGTLCYGAQTYIKRLMDICQQVFGEKPKTYVSPLEKGDHPELDLTELCDEAGIKKYQSIIGALQWTISLCRFDIAVSVMTMGRFRMAPRQGHLERLKRICGYLRNFPHAAICFQTNLPTHEDHLHKIQEHDWMYAVYGNIKEELPSNMPMPKGNIVRTTSFVDANLMHDFTNGRSATGILHMINATPIEWFSKRQNTVESATYGSEFTAARQATDQIVDLRYTLRMLGVPLDGPAWLFGDNQSVVTSSTLPHSPLSKRHNALAYHRVREAISAKTMHFLHLVGIDNPADVLTKFLPWNTARAFIEPLLMWKGDTTAIAPTKEGSDKTQKYQLTRS